MRIRQLVLRNLTWFWRTNLAVVAAVAIATAVLCGALAVGDSVRASLLEIATSRLGKTQQVLASTTFFREALSETFPGSAPLVALEAFAVNDRSRQGAGSVAVYGIDDRFYQFHERKAKAPQGRSALVSPGLVRELGLQPGDSMLLRLEQPTLIPREFLHGRKETTARTLRYSIADAVSPAALPDFALRPQQGEVRAVFVPLSRLQRDLERDGLVNTLLLNQSDGPQLIRTVTERYELADIGLTLKPVAGAWSLEHQSTLLDDAVAQQAEAVAKRLKLQTSAYFTYLANTIQSGDRTNPYSLITAADDETLSKLTGQPIPAGSTPPIVLTDWLAQDLSARVGAPIRMQYFVWSPEGQLVVRSTEFRVAAIIPLKDDRTLAPEFPGITDNDSISDWDPPFPVDLKLVRPKDEAYWKSYRTTPKAWIRLATGQELWGTRYGRLTSLRFSPVSPELPKALHDQLKPLASGLTLINIGVGNREAAKGTTDFGEYFLYFSFFLLISALLLAALFFRLGIEQRARELGLLRSLGFNQGELRRIFLFEGAVLATVGVLAGLLLSVAYGALLVYGLRTWWVDAVGTTLLSLRVGPTSLLGGAAGAWVVSLFSVWWTLRGLRDWSPRGLMSGEPGAAKSRRWIPVVAIVLALLLIGLGQAGAIPAAAAFFGSGSLLLIGLLTLTAQWLRRTGDGLQPGTGALAKLGARNAGWRPGRSILCVTLMASATFLILSLESFKRTASDAPQQWPLLAESQAPLLFDPNTPIGRENLNLGAVPASRWELFRLRPGDDVSCLNLFAPRNPRILGARSSYLSAEGLAALDEAAAGGAVPAAMDRNSMTYVMHKKLGDEVSIQREGAEPIRLKLVAALDDTVFQSELIIAEKHFLQLFPHIDGYRVFLLSAPVTQAGAYEDALSDFGFDATSVSARLAAYHRVENTYISTFQALGGLGVLLGTLGMAAVLLRNALERRRELGLLRALGYAIGQVEWIILAENLLLLGAGLSIGALCAMVAVLPAILARGGGLPWLSLGLVLSIVFIAGASASALAARAAMRGPLLAALRSE